MEWRHLRRAYRQLSQRNQQLRQHHQEAPGSREMNVQLYPDLDRRDTNDGSGHTVVKPAAHPRFRRAGKVQAYLQ